MTDFCFVGHACIDIINGKTTQEGGACIYGAELMRHLVGHVSIVTSIASDFPRKKYAEIAWLIQPSNVTTIFRHSYEADKRVSQMENPANNIDPAKVPTFVCSADTVILCPIVHEITPEIINVFSSEWVALLPQGWFRTFDGKNFVRHSTSIFQSLPRKIKLIVISQEDANNDPAAWKWIVENAEVAVRTMGKRGYVLSVNKNESIHNPTKVFDETDSTGCGDIFSTSLMYLLRKGLSPSDAAEKAGHAAGLASTKIGIIESAKIAADYLKTA